MGSKHTSREVVIKHCGRFNVDILSGWEKALAPKEKIGARLYEHMAPAHLTGTRYMDWLFGYSEGQKYKATHMQRWVYFAGHNAAGEVVIRRKGWNVNRGKIVTRMQLAGCAGDVKVMYFNEDNQVARTVNCGI